MSSYFESEVKMMDWSKEIPRIIKEDGTIIYDCDIFGGDLVDLSGIKELRITGNLSLGNKAKLGKVVEVGESIFIGDDFLSDWWSTLDGCSPDDYYIKSGINAFFGCKAQCRKVIAKEIASFGHHADVRFVKSENYAIFCDFALFPTVSAKNISFGPNSQVGEINTINATFGNNCSVGRVEAKGDVTFGTHCRCYSSRLNVNGILLAGAEFLCSFNSSHR